MARCGSEFWLEIQHPTLDWVDLHGQQSTTGTVSNEQVDVTTKETMSWRKLSNCGMRMGTISASGVIADRDSLGPDAQAVTTWINEQAAFGNLINARIRIGNQKIILSGLYQVASYERTGDHNDAEKYSITLESSNNLANYEFPVFSFFPPTTFAHGWSVRRLRIDFDGDGPLVAYRVSDGATATIPWDSSNNYADVKWLEAWLNGSQGLLTYAYDQAQQGTLPSGDPEPLMDLEQLDVNEMPRLSDESGNVYTNSAGILEIEFQRAGESFGLDRFLESDQRDFGPPAGGVDVVFVLYAGRSTVTGLTKKAFSQGPGAWGLGSRFTPGNGDGWQWSPDGPNLELFSGDDVTQPHVATGAVSDNTPKILMVNGKSITGPASPQSWGRSRVYWGRASNSANTTWIGFMQEAWSYYEDASQVTEDYINNEVALIQQYTANSLGFTI